MFEQNRERVERVPGDSEQIIRDNGLSGKDITRSIQRMVNLPFFCHSSKCHSIALHNGRGENYTFSRYKLTLDSTGGEPMMLLYTD